MIATAVAVLCHVLVAGKPAERCVEEIVSDHVGWQECLVHNQIGVSHWMAQHPLYRHGWRVKAIKCVPGHYVLPRAI